MNNNHPLHQSSLDLWPGETTAGQVLERIRTQSRDETEKGRWFENLVKQVLLNRPEMEVEEVHRWSEWPDREELTGLDGRDLGTDLVARLQDGSWVAVQCKCHAREHRVPKSEIDSFLSHSQRDPFALRWVIATSLWSSAAEVLLETPDRPVRRFDFMDWTHEIVAETTAERPVRQPWALQATAIADVVEGLRNHERGRLVMACGTGKTFVALRVAEQIVPDGGAILFLAPSIALVSQARREWLRHTTRPVSSRVICSDNTAGGRNEDEDVRVSELECPVTTDPLAIAAALATSERTRVVFCTYQSLQQVSLAQRIHGAPDFDLTIADEAHRTTGIDRTWTSDNGLFSEDHFAAFQGVHHADLLASDRRLYMTATPRIYTAVSKARRRQEGYKVVDMSDSVVYGPELHRLSFARAVEHDMLSDYRVIVLGVRDSAVTPGLRQQLVALGEEQDVRQGRKRGKFIVKASDMMRVLGTSLAINGVTEGDDLEKPARLLRTLGFANSIKSSRFYTEALDQPLVKRTTTVRKRKQDGTAAAALPLEVRHLDASHSALERNAALRELANASVERKAQMVCNVRLFTEGVDVPSLDAVVFMEPRDSQVDVVQAVGRVMRKAPGKRFGYIVIPIAIEPGKELADALEQGTEGYAAVGRVLRALQAHDGRLAEEPLTFVQAYETGGNGKVDGEQWEQETLNIEQASEGIFAKVVNASGLGRPGLLVSQEIEAAVKNAAAVLVEAELERDLAEVLGLAVDTDGGARGVCTIAALLLANACLLHRRLCDVPHMGGLADLNAVGGSQDPRSVLMGAWHAILKRDYAPVFEPAVAVMEALPFNRAVMDAVRSLAECANRLADSLSELGYDHAGPLYHRILGSAKSDGAFYTNNVSAVLLARLALSADLVDWSNPTAVAQLRVIDPACGTGTLLMGALQAIKARIAASRGRDVMEHTDLHRVLVEQVLCGLDINRHGVQLAACNLTLGAPTVDYQRMNLMTMRHGPQPDSSVAAGSLEILRAAGAQAAEENPLLEHVQPLRTLQDLQAEQVNRAEEKGFPLRDLDVVIMNPPFTDNRKRGRKYSEAAVKQMQAHELAIRDEVQRRDYLAGNLINANSIATYFSPLADVMLNGNRGTLAKVVPVTAATGSAGLDERRFLAERFHVERIVTTHDPKRINFSENTGIHECLVVCRRFSRTEDSPPTEFVSLRRMPGSAEEAAQAAEAIVSGTLGEWGNTCLWPAALVQSGDWTPTQWFDGGLAAVAKTIETSNQLQPIERLAHLGPPGQGVQGAFEISENWEEGCVPGFHSVSSKLRTTLEGEPDVWYRPRPGKEHLAQRHWQKRSHFLVAMRHDTVAGRLTATWSPTASLGWWVPVSIHDHDKGKALTVWWNSTPTKLLLFNRRAKKLTYPMWQVAHLREIRVPKPDNPGWDALRAAYDLVCNEEILPMKQAMEDPAREIIDAAAAEVLGLDEEVVADWRLRLSREPTVTNRPAPE